MTARLRPGVRVVTPHGAGVLTAQHVRMPMWWIALDSGRDIALGAGFLEVEK